MKSEKGGVLDGGCAAIAIARDQFAGTHAFSIHIFQRGHPKGRCSFLVCCFCSPIDGTQLGLPGCLLQNYVPCNGSKIKVETKRQQISSLLMVSATHCCTAVEKRLALLIFFADIIALRWRP